MSGGAPKGRSSDILPVVRYRRSRYRCRGEDRLGVGMCDAIPVRGSNATRDNLRNALRLYYTLFVAHESIEELYEKLSVLKSTMSSDTLPECFKACRRKREAIGQVNFDLVRARGERPRVKVSYWREDKSEVKPWRQFLSHVRAA